MTAVTCDVTPEPAITQRDGGVLIRGDALPLMYRCTLALIARRHRDGLAVTPLLQKARTTFYRACMSPARHRDDAHTLAESRCAGQDGALINSAAAAHLLGLSRRQTQRLAAPSHARPCVRPRARSQRRLGVDVVVCGALRGCYVP